MRRVLSSLMLVVVTLLMIEVAYASSSSKLFYLDDLEMSIEIPNEYIVFTRDISDNDPNLSTYGLNKDDLLELMVSRTIYLCAWDDAVNFEFFVTMTMLEDSISNFNSMSDATLNFLASYLKTEYANSGATLEKYELYQHEQTKFIKIYSNKPNGSNIMYNLQYYIVYNNKAIVVTMQSYSGTIDSEKETILESIVNTVHFGKDPMLPEASAETDALVYEDNETGSKFTIPANWSQEVLSQDRENLDIRFTSNEEPGLCILYGSTDIWAELSSSEREGLSRADINSSVFSLEELAEIMGVDQRKASTVSYGGKEYCKYVLTSTSSTYGIDIEVTMTCLMRIENGYIYMFQFSGDENNSYYSDFESLLKSVKYPVAGSVDSSNVNSKLKTMSVFPRLLLSLLITILVYSIPIAIYRFCIVKKPVEKNSAKKITIVYGAVAFVALSVLIYVLNGNGAAGAAILLWSWVNYRVLITGTEKSNEEIPNVVSSSSPEKMTNEKRCGISEIPNIVNNEETDADNENVDSKSLQPSKDISKPRIMYCRRCGAKLTEGGKFCGNCGIKIEENSK